MKIKDITGQKFGRLTALYRLHNTKGRTKWYGGRGIDVCNEWKNDFQAFYNWAIERALELEVK